MAKKRRRGQKRGRAQSEAKLKGGLWSDEWIMQRSGQNHVTKISCVKHVPL